MRRITALIVGLIVAAASFVVGGSDMSLPVLIVEFAPGDNWNDASPTWVEITDEVRHNPGFRIRRGRQTPFTRMRPSTLTLTLDNSTGNFDPDNTSGAYASDLVPMVPIRVRATHNSVTYDLFRGFVTDWVVGQRDFSDTFTTVEAIDGLSVLQLSELTDAWGDQVAKLSPRAWWRLNETSGTTAIDSSGNGHHGTWEGSPTFTTTNDTTIVGRPGGYANIDGVDDRVSIPIAAAFTGTAQAFSISAWFNSPAGEGSYMYWQTFGASGATKDTASLYVSGGPSNQQVIGDILGPAGSNVASGLGSTTKYDDGEWHFAVVTYDGNLTYKLYVDNVLKDTTVETDGTLTLVKPTATYIAGFVNEFYEPGDVVEVALFDTELSSTNVTDLFDAAQGWPTVLTSQRATDLLDLMGWPSADRSISTGKTTLGAMTAVSSFLAGMFEAQDGEDGELYLDGAGKVVFTNRHTRNISTYAATFSNDGSDTPYRDFRWVSDEQLLRNVGRITDTAGAVREGRDTASVTKYATRGVRRTSQTTSATEPQDYADWLAAEFGTARRRGLLTILGASGTSNADWAELLSRELGDLVSVENTPISGGAQNQYDFFVEDIRLRADTKLWEMSIGLSPAVRQRMFTLDDDVLGKLDRDHQGLLGW